jgi:hypothetical protein
MITNHPRSAFRKTVRHSGSSATVACPRMPADYLHEEYGTALSDYVFINIWAEPKGQAWSYQAAYDLVLRLRARTGIAFDPHWFRHSAATRFQPGRPAACRAEDPRSRLAAYDRSLRPAVR